jgi:signal transduction histidine kinase
MAEPPALRANRMDLVARWADDLAHEIKNPLHAMVINLELVRRRAGSGDPEALVQRVEVVESELERVHALVESLLRLLRPLPDRGFAHVDNIFDDLLPVFRARARIRKIEYEHQPGGGVVALATGSLILVLLNLIDQAIEQAGETGRIWTGCQVTGDQVRIIIRNTATGAEPVDAGVGLAIARGVVQEAGGELITQAASGTSDTVTTVVLPRADTA